MAACCSAEMEKTVTKNIRNKTNPVFILDFKKYISQFRNLIYVIYHLCSVYLLLCRVTILCRKTEETAIIDATDKSICLAIITNVIVNAIIAFSLKRKVLSIRLYKSKK